ncbi:MAG: asparagine synthase (glutamine-hydrolyzing) [Deltaproteobacteria bacterium]|nr:asparagine synthase (glutamine-hydrolyzing) [Deltaproteobacteria bacterium]MBW2077821.1 asparagine synthase (glutamine-hydrolyzing) [Deltaproteobacteria bacterium]MBW2310073.1 asparagine synthase (glutamine-hydrolyzing) [Deltaproteobacteria bacterium]
MCGICGIFNLDGEPVAHRSIESMTDALAHRGPDDEGHYIDRNIALGHRRLAVLDLTPAGHQPMSSQDGTIVVVYNGEIYNHLELKAELEALGYQFRSRTDTEVLLIGYEEWGLDVVERLNGMFAFGLWDGRNRTLYLIRDRYGIKPLYWTKAGNSLIFASEIKAILTHPLVSVRVNPDALTEYFTFQNLFRYHTLFKGINLLQAASIRWIREGDQKLRKHTWWDYDFTKRDEGMSLEDAREETLRLFRQAVVRQLRSDVPVGSYLSGGMDSGSIVAVAATHIPRLSTFTCGFDLSSVTGVEANFDERREAEIISCHFKTEHYQQVVNASDLSWALPNVVWHLENPRLGMSYPNFYVSRLASKFVKVCLSGAGGDELYAGYPWRYYHVLGALGRDQYLRQYYDFWQRLVSDDDKPTLFTEELWRKVKYRDTFQPFSRVFTFNEGLKYDSPEEHIANSLYFEIKTFLAGLFLVGDKLSMAHGLEERIPFLDNDLVEFAQRIPIRHKLANLGTIKKLDENETKKLRRYREFDTGKNVLRSAMSDLLPPEVLRRRKQGFSAPDESWYRGEALDYVMGVLLDKKAAYRDFLNPRFVARIVERHSSGEENYRLLLWSFLCFEFWCEIFLDGRRVEYM